MRGFMTVFLAAACAFQPALGVAQETTGTLMCGNDHALTHGDIVGPAIAAEDIFRYSSLNPAMGSTIRRLAALKPQTLALMHGPSFAGDGAAALHGLADDYDRRVSGPMRIA